MPPISSPFYWLGRISETMRKLVEEPGEVSENRARRILAEFDEARPAITEWSDREVTG